MQCLVELMVAVDEVEVADEGVGAGPRWHARRAACLEVGVDERRQQQADAQRQPHPGAVCRSAEPLLAVWFRHKTTACTYMIAAAIGIESVMYMRKPSN